MRRPSRSGSKRADGCWRIGLDEADANALLPFKISMANAEHIAACFTPRDRASLLVGVAPADVHNRDPRELPLLTAGARIYGDGVFEGIRA